MDQIYTVFKKNIKVLFKTKSFIQSMYLPFATAVFAIIGKHGGNIFVICKVLWPVYQVVAVNGFMKFAMLLIVNEKNERQKENQKIMGLKQINYMIAHVLFSLITTVLIGFMYLIPTLIGDVYEEVDTSDVILAYFTFCIAVTAQVFFFSCFFTNSKIAVEAIGIINLIFAFCYTTVFVTSIRTSSYFLLAISMFPQAAISFSFFSYGWLFDSNQISGFKFTYDQGVTYMAISFAGYLLAYLYFDQVWPNDFGTQKKPWFIFNPIIRLFKKENDYQNLEEEQVYADGESLENKLLDHSSALFSQNNNVSNLKKAVSISNLVKSFSGFKAINKLSLNLYEGQIFCLLGHNGAGKTTTINVITGMQKKTSGKVIMNGLDIDDNLDLIRKNIGLCSQKDILYDVLSVEEHLQYYANIKGIKGDQQIMDIEYVIQKCKLQNERKKWAMHLSGGNKRKLCLAISLVGKAKLIFLDEPTSGVDPVTRSQIWEILQEIKNDGRVIVLTTHHLEEAEVLADRIGIMARGQLLALGTVQYITRQFGTGYYLKLTNKLDTPEERQNFILAKENIKQAVLSVISEAQFDAQSQENVIRALLPFHCSHLYPALFLLLEQNPKVMINLQMNSLEDAFVNIGMDEDKFFAQHGGNSRPSDNSADDHSPSSNAQELHALPTPSIIHRKPEYNMIAQVIAIMKRRFIYLVNDWINLLSLIAPFIFAFLGAIFNSGLGSNGSPTLYIIFMIFSLSFHSMSFVGLTILEKEKHLKYSLRVMGCKMTAYWTGCLLSELILSIPISLIFLGIFKLSGVSLASQNQTDMQFLVLIWVFTFSFICCSFFYSHLFTTVYDAVIGLPFFLLFPIFFLCLVFVFTGFLDSGYQMFQIVAYVFSPPSVIYAGYTISFGINGIVERYPWLGQSYQSYYSYGIIQSVVFLVLAVVLDYKSFCKKSTQPTVNNALQVNDQDVAAEDRRVISSNDRIKAMRITKQYPNGHTAINTISFGVQPKQIFGLLGPNGAGKSTSFNILTAKDSQFSGRATINNETVSETNENAWESSGVCPQFDCLWDHLTPKDHLEIYASLKGFTGDDRKEIVDYYLHMMKLEEYTLRKSMNLSGGNKRKLGVCMSLIGGPSVQFLDEPSSGLDPVAKRFLWNTLQSTIQTRESSIVLTTHSMNEAESLCNKIGILINGQFSCMGSPEHLSSKFGNGYRLSLKLKNGVDSQQVHAIVMQNMLHAMPIPSKAEGTIQFQIHEQSFVFSKAFTMIQKMQEFLIDDFSLHHANLEQIFSYFAGFQQEYVEPPRSNTSDEICNCKGANCVRWCTLACCCCVW